jgi:acyl-CoA synthetase (AMP-forming)/AMP-acid ligase II
MTAATRALLASDRLPTITFLGPDGERELDLARCAGQVVALAAVMRDAYAAGARVGLLFPSEPDLVLCWLAALHAGLEPLILQYPNAKQNLVTWRKSIDNTYRGVGLAGILCSPALEGFQLAPFRPRYVRAPDAATAKTAAPIDLPADAAILQMSSGTTGHRKPIRFTLGQVASHAQDYNVILQLSPEDRVVSWLPLYHDMGFIACFAMPLLLGIPVVMMDPITWVRNPRSLFEAIDRHAATTCYMPNFGFEVMSRHGGKDSLQTMRRWISCSEPVYAGTMRRFAAATRTPLERLAACYAMAENVFAVSQHDGLKTLQRDGRELVCCGKPIPGTEVKVVEEEIWLRSGTSITAYVDGSPIVDAEGYFPSGDLGAVIDGELVVFGRKRDLINVAGRKLVLSDLDQSLNEVFPAAEGRAVALARHEAEIGTEVPLLLVEDRDFYRKEMSVAEQNQLRSAIDVETFSLEFVPSGFLTKTSSGKINRGQTLANHELARQWRRDQGERGDARPSAEAEFWRLFGAMPGDVPVGALLDSLGLVNLSTLLADAAQAFDPELTLGDYGTRLRQAVQARRDGVGADNRDHIAIVSIADGRIISKLDSGHLEQLAAAAGMPVTVKHLCLPPTPVILSDLVFFDYFLPRDSGAKYSAVVDSLATLRDASLLLVDDVAELLFGRFAYPALNPRFERSAIADQLVWRWQKYAANHHLLPVSVVNLWDTQAKRNDFIARLSAYLRIPVFRIATLESFAALTEGWDYVERVNADWTTDLAADADALAARLAAFLQQRRGTLRHRTGPVDPVPVIDDLPHFCCLRIDSGRVEPVLRAHARFCIIGPESSLSYVRRRILELGKTFIQTSNLNLPGQKIADADFDCVLQTGSWGRPVTAKPVFQLFDAGWDPALQPGVVNGTPITDRQWFHQFPGNVPEELAGPKNVLWPLARATVSPSLTWRF